MTLDNLKLYVELFKIPHICSRQPECGLQRRGYVPCPRLVRDLEAVTVHRLTLEDLVVTLHSYRRWPPKVGDAGLVKCVCSLAVVPRPYRTQLQRDPR